MRTALIIIGILFLINEYSVHIFHNRVDLLIGFLVCVIVAIVQDVKELMR